MNPYLLVFVVLIFCCCVPLTLLSISLYCRRKIHEDQVMEAVREVGNFMYDSETAYVHRDRIQTILNNTEEDKLDRVFGRISGVLERSGKVRFKDLWLLEELLEKHRNKKIALDKFDTTEDEVVKMIAWIRENYAEAK